MARAWTAGERAGVAGRRRAAPAATAATRIAAEAAAPRGAATARGATARPSAATAGTPPRATARAERTEAQARYDGPPLPEEITGKELDRSVLAQLRSLPEKLGQRVARHLAAAGALIDEDPEDGLPAHARRACPRQPAGRRARGVRRGGVRRG